MYVLEFVTVVFVDLNDYGFPLIMMKWESYVINVCVG